MKRVFLVMVVSAMLVTLGFAQTPDAGSNTNPASVKGCLGGSDGNYTVVEDGTGQIFKISTSSVDLKPHLGHGVKLTGHRASAAGSSGAAGSSFTVTELSMISEHCAAAAAPAVVVTPSPETVIPPDGAAAAPATASVPAGDAAAPAAPVNPPSETSVPPVVDATAPAATVSPSSATVSAPAVEAAAPATTVGPSSATVTSAAAEAAPAPRPSAHVRKLAAKQAAAATASDTTVSPSSDTVTPAPPDAATPATTAASSPQTVSPSDAAAPALAPAPTAIHRAGSLTLLISFVVLVIVLGTMAPLIGRWRKRKMLERTGGPNLSFTNEASTTEVAASEASADQDKPEPRKVA